MPEQPLSVESVYPELHAEASTATESMRAAIAGFAAEGAPVYAECGGFMSVDRTSGCSGINDFGFRVVSLAGRVTPCYKG